MKIYLVLYEYSDGEDVCSVWDTKEAALAERERLQAEARYFIYTVDEWDVNDPDGHYRRVPS